jgi:hypothetical protein
MGRILRVLRLEVSVYNVYITNQFQTTFDYGHGTASFYLKLQGTVRVSNNKKYIKQVPGTRTDLNRSLI